MATPAPRPPATGVLVHLATLLSQPVTDRDGHRLGTPVDVVVRLRAEDYPTVTGLVVTVGDRRLFVPVEQITSLHAGALVLSSTRVDLRPFERRIGEVLLRADVLVHRLIDLRDDRLVRARDIELANRDGIWTVASVDTGPQTWWHRVLRTRRATPTHQGWKAFEPLIGPEHRAVVRAVSGLHRLKVAQIADLVETASTPEQTTILAELRTAPELEADVFEELDVDDAVRLLEQRTNGEVAAVLSRMRADDADDAADALADLAQHRRQPVLDLLPVHQRVKVRMLLGFNPTSAGGLMGVDFVTVPGATDAARALAVVAAATTIQPEALTSVHVVNGHGRLYGVAPLVRLLQADPRCRSRFAGRHRPSAGRAGHRGRERTSSSASANPKGTNSRPGW